VTPLMHLQFYIILPLLQKVMGIGVILELESYILIYYSVVFFSRYQPGQCLGRMEGSTSRMLRRLMPRGTAGRWAQHYNVITLSVSGDN